MQSHPRWPVRVSAAGHAVIMLGLVTHQLVVELAGYSLVTGAYTWEAICLGRAQRHNDHGSPSGKDQLPAE